MYFHPISSWAACAEMKEVEMISGNPLIVYLTGRGGNYRNTDPPESKASNM